MGMHPRRTQKKLGVLGTLVWDRILFDDGRLEPVEEWGGISYTLEALSVVLPPEWVIKPLLKLGSDFSDKAEDYVGSIPRVETGDGVQEVPAPTTRSSSGTRTRTPSRRG